jgi:hypothetical protein
VLTFAFLLLRCAALASRREIFNRLQEECIATHDSRLTTRDSRFMTHDSRLTTRESRLAIHVYMHRAHIGPQERTESKHLSVSFQSCLAGRRPPKTTVGLIYIASSLGDVVLLASPLPPFQCWDLMHTGACEQQIKKWRPHIRSLTNIEMGGRGCEQNYIT